MLKQENFEMNHINFLKMNSNSDPAILERTVYAFMRTVEAEISYRGNGSSAEEALLDTIGTASCIISRGNNQPEEYRKLMGGIKSIQLSFWRNKINRSHQKISILQQCCSFY